MKKLSGVFLSEIAGKGVYDMNNIYLGKLKDIIVTDDEYLPAVYAVKIKNAEGIKSLTLNKLEIYEDNKIKIIIKDYKEMGEIKNCYSLIIDFLDKQVVDIDGRRVVRVNDLRMDKISGAYKLVAVDIGIKGLLRRLGAASLFEKIYKLFNKKMLDALVMWDNVEPINGQIEKITLSVPYKKLKSLHPADIADILEEIDVRYRSSIFNTFDTKLAADTLEEFETDVQTDIIENIDENRAKEIFDNMPTDEIADILDTIDEDQAEKILGRMDKDDAEDVRELLNYSENTTGSIMTLDYTSFYSIMTVDETIVLLRKIKPDSDTAYYLYITDEDNHLVGTVSLRDLIISSGDMRLSEIMNKDVIYIKDSDNLNEITSLVIKYDLLAVPVVDDNMVLKGMVALNDIVDEIFVPRWKKFLKKVI